VFHEGNEDEGKEGDEEVSEETQERLDSGHIINEIKVSTGYDSAATWNARSEQSDHAICYDGVEFDSSPSFSTCDKSVPSYPRKTSNGRDSYSSSKQQTNIFNQQTNAERGELKQYYHMFFDCLCEQETSFTANFFAPKCHEINPFE